MLGNRKDVVPLKIYPNFHQNSFLWARVQHGANAEKVR